MKTSLQCFVFAAIIVVAEVAQPCRDLIELGLQALNNLRVGGHGDTGLDDDSGSKRSMDLY